MVDVDLIFLLIGSFGTIVFIAYVLKQSFSSTPTAVGCSVNQPVLPVVAETDETPAQVEKLQEELALTRIALHLQPEEETKGRNNHA